MFLAVCVKLEVDHQSGTHLRGGMVQRHCTCRTTSACITTALHRDGVLSAIAVLMGQKQAVKVAKQSFNRVVRLYTTRIRCGKRMQNTGE